MNVLVRRRDEALEQRMRLVRLAHEFRMELARNVKGMIFQFDDFHELAVGRRAAENEAGLLKFLAVVVVELVAMAMAFVDDEGAVKLSCLRADGELARLRAEAHRAALLGDFALRVKERDDGVRGVFVELGGVRFLQFQNAAGKFNRGNLHTA